MSSAFRHLSRTVLLLAGRGVCIILVKESETEKRSFFALFKFIRSCRQYFYLQFSLLLCHFYVFNIA